MSNYSLSRARRFQNGLTLIELLVALAVGLIVVLVATTALVISQQGYRTVDSSTQLRDRERFAIDLLSRVIVQAGYQDYGSTNIALRSTANLAGINPEPDIFGWNNAVYATPGNLALSGITEIVNGNRPTSSLCTAADTSCKNGSDILVVRYQGATSHSDTTKPDNSMINCRGEGEIGLKFNDVNDRAFSIFHVTRGVNGEPSLSCSYYNFDYSPGGVSGWIASTPMVEGVESFQVLYGTEGVVPSSVPSTTATLDTVSERWLRADELTVAGNAAATRENFRRVRAVRIGLVMRGAVGSAQQTTTATFAPLGSYFTSANDNGSSFAAPADARVRLQNTFTVHLRNDLSLR